MLFPLRWDDFADAAELLLNVFDLMPRGLALLHIQVRGRGSRQTPLSAFHNRSNHFQVA